MHRILSKKQLSAEVFEMTVEAPRVAKARKAGQFVILQVDLDWGERIPLTIADADSGAGTITLVFQTIGATTHRLAAKQEGGHVAAILGPLGNPTHIEKFGAGRVVCVGGGIGAAPLYPIVQALKAAGNRITVIIGARTKDLIIFEERLRSAAGDGGEVIIVTDDGSLGRKALVTDPLREYCSAAPPPDMAVAIGPAIMMKFCEKTTMEFHVPIMVSLNTIMIDGTGMCGGCRVTVGGETKFVCVDGPEFDGHQVDFDNMMLRMKAFQGREARDHHRCHLDLGLPPLEKH
ncbi:MAG: sulfide/dihydroorotate dehydrogenase-like FAD/NAD-binding protein [Spirochaetaceae bacterium]|jgi:ferredoxin--NADP+ reductase|nr:sulfide/dihydroorotate dehydrogenase-like FAD/NAD-binding protein [Spirochaetaceae bacterium]